MKAAVIHEYGGPEVLRYQDVADPALAPGEVLIRVAAASVNPIDTYLRSGKRKESAPLQFPAILGWDVSGTVEALGRGTTGFSVGDKVLAWANHSYAELCAVQAKLLTRLPSGLDLTEAAAIPLVGLTGSQMISVAGNVQAGQTVLVSGATGAVGRAAVFTAKERGAVVIGGIRRRQLDQAKSLGIDDVVVLDDEMTMNRLMCVDVVANTVRGKTAEQLLGIVKKGGIFASVTGAPANAGDHGAVRVTAYVSKQDPAEVLHLAEAVRDGKLTIAVGQRLPLSRASEAHAGVERGGIGKVLLLP
jgi:NADPH:quinone reductase-like Zn-dependent oxidoreductase